MDTYSLKQLNTQEILARSNIQPENVLSCMLFLLHTGVYLLK